MEYLLVILVAALVGYLAYRLSLAVGRRLAGDEVLQVRPPPERTIGRSGLAEHLGASPGPAGEARREPRSHRSRRRRGAQDPAPDAFAYGAAPLPPLRIPARTRLLGLLRLVALIVLAAALLAVALYQAGHLVRLQFEAYLR